MLRGRSFTGLDRPSPSNALNVVCSTLSSSELAATLASALYPTLSLWPEQLLDLASGFSQVFPPPAKVPELPSDCSTLVPNRTIVCGLSVMPSRHGHPRSTARVTTTPSTLPALTPLPPVSLFPFPPSCIFHAFHASALSRTFLGAFLLAYCFLPRHPAHSHVEIFILHPWVIWARRKWKAQAPVRLCDVLFEAALKARQGCISECPSLHLIQYIRLDGDAISSPAD